MQYFKFLLTLLFIMVSKQIELEIKEKTLLTIVLFSFLIFTLARNLQVTLISPIAFGDEGFHSYTAYLFSDLKFPIWTDYVGNNLQYGSFSRPPLWNILEGAFLLLLLKSELVIRILTPLIAFLTGISTFVLAKKIWNEKVAFFASILTVSFPSFVTYSVLFYTDILFTFYFSIFFFTFLLWKKTNDKKYFILSASFAALAFLTKRPGFFIFPFLLFAFVYELYKNTKRSKILVKNYLIFLFIALILVSGFLIRNIRYYNTPYCGIPIFQKYIDKFFGGSKCSINLWKGNYTFSGRTEEVGSEMNIYKFGLVNYVNFAYGNTWLFIIGVFSGIYLTYKKNSISPFILMFLVGLFLILVVSYARTEDTARYTLGWAPALASIIGVFLSEVYEYLKLSGKKIGILLAATLVVLILIIAYQNFSSKLSVMYQVKQFSKLFFEACDWVKENPDKVPANSRLYTIWAYRALYNCKRYVGGQVADVVFSRDVNETLKMLKELGYTHMFIQKFSIDPRNPHLVEKYDYDFVKFLESHPEAFEKIYENGPSLDECYYYWLSGYSCDGNIIYKINYNLLEV